ncbi:helix-turn-helix transcriptional regulator [Halopiger xanaduensis]|uniref:Transcriptional regulator, MarR family n=1 Tax=Halopiger xanaduensis (strain DSM 18323 / JCM 14033 / SH-6) TaxID=797210 RepID=F8D9Z5_HALXS|nr:MarR family transcriptional regulator [Halopiger xanaduensis]AEH36911.1 transcriptional regulator, MarR family [Halopiger xanaduensis SH-6]
MGDPTAPREHIAFLVRSDARIDILTRLFESGPATQRELRTELDSSRSTVARSLSALEECGWVERHADGHRLTPVGTLVAEGFLDFVETLRAAEDLSPFLEWFPLAEYDLEIDQLEGAAITPSTPGDPYKPGRAQTEFMRSTSRFRAFLPSTELEGTKLLHERVTNGDLEAELIVSPAVERTIESASFAPLYREQLRTDRMAVFVSDEPLPFYLGIDDDWTIQLGVEDDEGFPRALLETAEPSVAEWATELYREYRSNARRKPSAAFEDRLAGDR